MKISKRSTALILFAVFSTVLILQASSTIAATSASSDKIVLKFASFRPENDYWVPAWNEWVKDFAAKTGGRYAIEMSWAGGMGAPKDYYKMLTNGVFDFAQWQPTQLPGRFPISELLTLPIEAPLTSGPTMAYNELYKKGFLDKEFSDSKVLFVWAGAGNMIAQNKRPVSTLNEMKGIRIGNAGGYAIDFLKAANAVPVNMALGERYISIEKGVIDGTMGSWAPMYTAKFYEILHNATEPGICSAPFVMIMNKQTYEKLPKDVKAAIDEMSRSDKYAKFAGQLGDEDIEKGKKAFLEKNGKISQWKQEDYDKIGAALTPLWDKALAEAEAKGYPAKQAMATFYTAMKNLGSKQPFVGYSPGSK